MTKTDQDRIARYVAGAHERAVAKVHAIQALREKSIEADRTKPNKDGTLRWPMHSVTGRAPGAVAKPNLEAHVTVARARDAAGLDLSDLDRRALEAHPGPTEYEKAMAEAAARYREDLDPHGNPNAHELLQRRQPRAATGSGGRPTGRLGAPGKVRAVGSARRRS